MTETNGSDHSSARLGRYELRLELGRGSMGVVWEAFDPDLGRTVALKTIRADLPDAASRESFERRFFTEARIAARLQHRGIVVVHDVGRDTESGTLYMALEFLRGQTLAQRIAAGGALPWREAAVLMGTVGFLFRERWQPRVSSASGQRLTTASRAVVSAPAPTATAASKTEPAHPRVVFEHPVDAADLGVYVDGDLALKRKVPGQKKRIPALKLRSGRLGEVVDVAPGRRTILVEAQWSEGSRVETTSAEFESGRTLTLEASLGRLRKSLSLNWK